MMYVCQTRQPISLLIPHYKKPKATVVQKPQILNLLERFSL